MFEVPPKRVLAALDLSDCASWAWLHARELRLRFGCELEAVYVIEATPPPLPFELADAALALPEDRTLELLRDRVGDEGRFTWKTGRPADRILELARRRRADLIVMGTHGRKGLLRAAFGSVAEAVVRRSPAPVLTVKGPPRPVRSVLAPVHFEPWAEPGFLYAGRWAAALGARAHAFHAAADPRTGPNPKFLFALMQERCGQPGWTFEVRKGAPVPEILACEARHDLVVLTARRRSPVRDFVLGTTAEQVLRESRHPVLTVPVEEARAPGRRPRSAAAARREP